MILNLIFYLRSRMKIFDQLKSLKIYEFNSLKENLTVQQDNLKRLLLYSWYYIPYYNKILDEAGVVKDGKIYLENFRNIRILDKKTLAENFDLLQTTNKKYLKKMYLNSSGGSTGIPAKFIQDYEYKTIETASKWLYFTFLTNYPCKNISLWGSERDIIKNKFIVKKRVMNFLQEKMVLNSFIMTQENMILYVEKINQYHPIIIEAYVQSIFSLANFIKNNNLEIHSPLGIITSAGTLYPDMKELIEEVFHCPVLNRYGSRETGDIACSCKENMGLHVNIINNYVEILDENLESVKPGEIGQIYITKLTNYSMPLIRYRIGDLAIPSEQINCNCGRGFPLIKSIEGREMSVFKTKEGTIIPAEFFIHFIGVVFNEGIISKFQVIQNDYDLITIKYILGKKEGLEDNKNDIEVSIKKIMGENCRIVWDEVMEIPNLPSGKYLYTYSEIS